MEPELNLFLICVPGLERELADEAREIQLNAVKAIPGGVEAKGRWEDVWRANLLLRGATRVLVRLGQFKARNLGEVEARGKTFPWLTHLAQREPVSLDVTCRKSRISNANAVSQRFERALRACAIPVAPAAALQIKVRIDRDMCLISVDTSGEPLHKRGFKAAVSKAPMRETMAASFLRQAGYAPGEPVLDPMCGSGTFVLEAAEIAAGFAPGRARSFSFERLPSFNPARFQHLKALTTSAVHGRFFGFDRDAGAIRSARSNAARSGVEVHFAKQALSDLNAPPGPPGLVITNPPYGDRIGSLNALRGLYATLGNRMQQPGFAGWRVAIITSEPELAHATGLQFMPLNAPVAHGGLKVWMFRTVPLPG